MRNWVNEKWIAQKMNLLRYLYITEDEQCLLIYKKEKSKLSMTDWLCRIWLQKKYYLPTMQPWGFVTNFYAPIWVMGFHVLDHQTIIFRGDVFNSGGQYAFEVKKCVRNALFGHLETQISKVSLQCPPWRHLTRYGLSKQ